MNTQLVYFCKALGCNSEILVALKHCEYHYLYNKATIAGRQRFIDHIGSFCWTWNRVETQDFDRAFPIDYVGKTHKEYDVAVQKLHGTVNITIFNSGIAFSYNFQFEREIFTYREAWYKNPHPLNFRSKRIEYANDLKNMLIDHLNGVD